MKQQDNEALGILRGIAIGMVVINHLFRIPELNVPPGIASFLYWRSRMLAACSMDFFLVLLGFFMAASLFQDLEKRGCIDLLTYWEKRLIRIVPSYYLLLLVLACTGTTQFVDATDFASLIKSVLPHLLFLQNYLRVNPNGPTWFLGVAVLHYLLVPLLLTAINKMCRAQWRRIFPLVAIVMILLPLTMRSLWYLAGLHGGEDFNFTHFRTDSIFAGMLSQYILRYCPSLVERITARQKTLLVLAGALIAPYLFFSRASSFMFTIGFTLSTIGSAVITILFALGILNTLRHKLAFWGSLGEWSYNIYLWHFFLPPLLGDPYVRTNFLLTRLPLGYAFQIAVFVGISIIVGYGMTRWFERPVVHVLSRAAAK